MGTKNGQQHPAKRQNTGQGKGSVEGTLEEFKGRCVIGKVAILKHTPLVAGAGRAKADGPQVLHGYEGVVPMHECGDPDSPTGYGALVAYNGRGTYQLLMLGPFPNKAKAADVYDATVDRFHPPPAAGQRPKRKNFDANGRPAPHITSLVGVVYFDDAPDPSRPWRAVPVPVNGHPKKRHFNSRKQNAENWFEFAGDAAKHHNYRMDKKRVCWERNFGAPCNCGGRKCPYKPRAPAVKRRANGAAKDGNDDGNGGVNGEDVTDDDLLYEAGSESLALRAEPSR